MPFFCSSRCCPVILDYFSLLLCTSPHPNYPENQNFEKMKKASGDVIILNLSNNKHNHMMYAYSDMECNRQFFVILALLPQYWTWKFKFQNIVKNTRKYYPFTHVYHKSRSYDVWFLRYKVQRIEFFVIFVPFDPPNKPKKQNFEKIKKWPGDIIILHLSTRHDNHDVWFLRYRAWQTIFLSFWAIFWPYTFLTQKIKILKKWKKLLKILSFYTWVP